MKFAGLIAAVSILGVTANAQTGGFTGPDNRRLVTAIEIAELPDDENVHLVGYIVESIGDENYMFRDDTGTVVVEIDDDEWNGLEVSPEVRVEISGEVDRERDRVEIDVERIAVAN